MADLKKQMQNIARLVAPTSSVASSHNSTTTESTNNGNECVICIDGPKTIVLFPCKHLCLCSKCSATQNVKQCPICGVGVQYLLVIAPT